MDTYIIAPMIAGIVAVFNPCGFVMLPTYLTLLANSNSQGGSAQLGMFARFTRTLSAAFMMAIGFGLVMMPLGTILSFSTSWIRDSRPFLTMGVGIVLLGVGLFLFGKGTFAINLPKFAWAPSWGGEGQSQGLTSWVLYGAGFALASLGCTPAPMVVVGAIAQGGAGVLSAVPPILAYVVGMGTVVLVLGLLVALPGGAGNVWAARFRSFSVKMNSFTALFMGLAGLYLIAYGWFQYREANSTEYVEMPAVVKFFSGMAQQITDLVRSLGPMMIFGLVLAVLVAVTVGTLARYARAAQIEGSGARGRHCTEGQSRIPIQL